MLLRFGKSMTYFVLNMTRLGRSVADGCFYCSRVFHAAGKNSSRRVRHSGELVQRGRGYAEPASTAARAGRKADRPRGALRDFSRPDHRTGSVARPLDSRARAGARDLSSMAAVT